MFANIFMHYTYPPTAATSLCGLTTVRQNWSEENLGSISYQHYRNCLQFGPLYPEGGSVAPRRRQPHPARQFQEVSQQILIQGQVLKLSGPSESRERDLFWWQVLGVSGKMISCFNFLQDLKTYLFRMKFGFSQIPRETWISCSCSLLLRNFT